MRHTRFPQGIAAFTLAAALLVGLCACDDNGSSSAPAVPAVNELSSQDVNAVSSIVASSAPVTVYTVQKGDTLWAISLKYGTTVDAITVLNDLTSTTIKVGQQLKVPQGAVSSSSSVSAGSKAAPSKAASSGKTASSAAASSKPASSKAPNTYTYADDYVSFAYPNNWQYTKTSGEDGMALDFKDPSLNENAAFSYVTGEASNMLRTKAQFQDAYSQVYQNFVIKSLTDTKVGGYAATKLVFTYSSGKIEYTETMYNVAVGSVYRGFYCICPSSSSDSYTSIYSSIMASVKFK